MNSGRKRGSAGWRLTICSILMLWIFHSIFLTEGRTEWQGPPRWESLRWWEQWEVGWTSGPIELWRTLTKVSPGWLGVSVLFWGVTILLGVGRWRMVMSALGLRLPLARATEISFIAHFFNSFLLGSTGGDLLKAYFAARETHHRKAEAVVTVFVDRLIGLFSLLLFAVVMILPNLPMVMGYPKLLTMSGLILAMLLGCGGVAALAFRSGLSARWPKARSWLRRMPKGDVLERCLDACRVFGRHPGVLAQTVILSMILNTVCVLQILALARGMRLDLPLFPMFMIIPMIICISALPITPSGLGVRENLYVLMLAAPTIAVAPTRALSLSLLAYACSLAWSAVGGVLYLTLKESRHLDQVVQADPAEAG